MNKLLTSILTISSIVFAPVLQADDAAYELQDEQVAYDHENKEITSDTTNEEATMESEGTPVGQAANEGSNATRKKRWQNIALATTAVAVAVIALVLVANNDGHHHKDKRGGKH